MNPPPTNLIWIDLEMTGLDPDINSILEIAVHVTDSNLKILDKGLSLSIHHPDQMLNSMDKWNTKHHGESGLIDRSRKSKITMKKAEARVLQHIKQYTEPELSPLCGNSVWLDKLFLRKYMTNLHKYFFFRIIDVTTIKELVHRWYPNIPRFKKADSHQALTDILESIAELVYYKEKVFRKVEIR